MRIRIPLFVGLCVSATLALACAKKETARTDSVAAATGETALVTVASIDIGRSLNADKTIANTTDTFAKTDTIYASVATSGAGSATITARWTFQDGQIVDESTQTITPTGPARTEFHISKPGGWPVGKYRVEVSVNGTSAGTKEFEVK